MGYYAILAEALRYPAAGRLNQLHGFSERLPAGAIKAAYEKFLTGVDDLSLGAWEELYTRTLDLNPPAAPYIGYQSWGDSYQRGSFLSMLNRALEVHQIDTEGELADHLIPVLRLMDRLEEPFPELDEILETSIMRIQDGLKKADPENPYAALLNAIYHACKEGQSTSRTSSIEMTVRAETLEANRQ